MIWTKINLPAIKKHTRDNLGMIAAVLASLFAGWSGYEAHLARKSADDVATKTIALQNDSVQAQKEATQLDERPYISVIPSPDYGFVTEVSPEGSRILKFKIRLKLLTNGRMPALDVNLGWECDEYIKGKGPIRVSKEFRSGDEQFSDAKMLPFAYATTNGDGGWLTNFYEQEISQAGAADPHVFIVAKVTYKDNWHPHHNTFCLDGHFPEDSARTKPSYDLAADIKEFRFSPCSGFKSTFD